MSDAQRQPRYQILSPLERDPSLAGKCALAVMAKAPVPGKVKTRLSPPLTPLEAAELNACFLRDTVANLENATHIAPGLWVISYTPTGAEAAFEGILPEGALLLPQRGDDFGERLLRTAEDLFSCGFSAVCLIDSDSPTVPTQEFAQAAAELLRPGRRAVLGTSADGGYYLIGLQRAEPNLFERITWSSGLVAEETLERAREIDLPVTLLCVWYDVDDGESLRRLLSELHGADVQGGYRAPHTRAYLAKREQNRAISGYDSGREASVV